MALAAPREVLAQGGLVWPVLQRRSDLATISSNVEDLSKIHTQVLRSVAEALKNHTVLPICHLLLSIFTELGRMGTWCEGCACREQLLHEGEGSDRAKLLRYRKASANCSWAGHRGCELALGRLGSFIQGLRSSSSPQADRDIACASASDRAEYVEISTSLKNTFCGLVSAKLSYWRTLLGSILGVFAHMRGLCSLERSAQQAAEIIREVSEAIGVDGGRTLHRVARRLVLGDENLRSQLLKF